MSFQVEAISEQAVVIHVGERLDFRNAGELKSICQRRAQSGSRYFIFNFEETSVLDSSGLGAIFSLYRKLSSVDGQLALASPSEPVQTVVRLTRTDRIFDQFQSVAAAQNALLASETG